MNEVQRVVPKWTKRNHTAAVKVRQSKYPTDDRQSPGAHGSLICLLQEVEAKTNTFTSGPQPPEHEQPHSTLEARLHPSSGPRTPRRFSVPTDTQTTTSRSGRIHHSPRSTTCLLTTTAYLLQHCRLMDAQWLPEQEMRTSSSGRSGSRKLRRRVPRRTIATVVARAVSVFASLCMSCCFVTETSCCFL